MKGFVNNVIPLVFLLTSCITNSKTQYVPGGYTLVWADEFSQNGLIDTTAWGFETGFVRNNEHQWYQKENVWCEDGVLIIEGKKEKKKNPNYDPASKDWKKSREFIEYTSSSINTRRRHSWKYGYIEVKAKVEATIGLWPAIWTLGVEGEWPSNGEIDIMEYYRGDILANFAWGTSQRYTAKWDTFKKPVSSFNDPDWDKKFHVWGLEWNPNMMAIYLDGELLNEIDLHITVNDSNGKNPFHQPHYLLLNLAIGGDNGGDPENPAYPTRYIVDYVRVYQKK